MSEANPLHALSTLLADLTEAAAASIVDVHSHRALSSGFAWRPGLIVTADEALAEEGNVAVTLPGGERRVATVAGRDATTDIALLRVADMELRPAVLDAGPVRPGALVLAVGSGHGARLAAFGAVAHSGGRWRSMRGAAASRWKCGSPLAIGRRLERGRHAVADRRRDCDRRPGARR